MKIKMRFSWLVVLCLLCVPAVGLSQEAGEVTEGDIKMDKLDHGQVNWSKRVIRATGYGAPDLKAPNVAVARLGAERVAEMDAKRNILETLKGVRIESDVTINNEIVTSSKMRSKIAGVVRNYRITDRKYYSDGGVSLVVEMSLDGKLATTLLKPGAKAGEVPSGGEAKNSGLIIDASGLKALPALSPKLLDENGRVLYSAEFLDKASLESNGVVGYFRDLDAAKKAKRVSSWPLVLKALKLGSGSKSNIVLSNADAERLRDPKSNLKYLTEGRVIIVID